MKLADQIKKDLMRWISGYSYTILIPNIYWGAYEMDLMVVKPSGLVYEYEIKISRSDFFNDMKKGVNKWDGNIYNDFVRSHKHTTIQHGDRLCNRFYFVVPEGLVKKDEVPAYAGLIYHTGRSFDHVKTGKILHRNKFDDYKTLAQRLAFRAHIITAKNERLKMNLKELKLVVSQTESA